MASLFDRLSLPSSLLHLVLVAILLLANSATSVVAALLLSFLQLSQRRHRQLLALLRAAQLASLAALAVCTAVPRLLRQHALAYGAPRVAAALAHLLTAVSLFVRVGGAVNGWRVEPTALAFDCLSAAALHAVLVEQCGCESVVAGVGALGRRLTGRRALHLYRLACRATCAVTQWL